jgi:hypothetical protein
MGSFTPADPNNAVEPRSLALFFALLSAFVVVLTLRTRLLGGPSQQAAMALGSTPDPISMNAKTATRLPRSHMAVPTQTNPDVLMVRPA